MKPIDLKIHGVLDYVLVVIFVLGPLIFELSGFPAILSYILAVVHLVGTLLTDFELGVKDLIKIDIHQMMELATGPILIILAFFFATYNLASAGVYYILLGAVILLLPIFTNFSTTMEEEVAEPKAKSKQKKKAKAKPAKDEDETVEPDKETENPEENAE